MKWFFLILLSLAMADWAQAQTTRPTVAVDQKSCVTAECHPKVKQYKVIHGPVNVNACEACHKLTDAKEHKFEQQRDKTQTCTFCHKIDTTNMPVVHKPVTQGECLQCHNPHGGVNKNFTRGTTEKDLCNRCHEDVMAGKTAVHGPVAAGSCSSCHQSHASQNKKLLVAEGRALCFNCHLEMKNQMKTAKVVHKAAEQDCITCHDAHASNFPKQIKQAPLDLCTSCHEHDPIKKSATESKHQHSVVIKGIACLNCHTAHGGDLPKLMKNEPIKVCMKCHNDPIKVNKELTIPAVSEVLDPATFKHGPIRDGNCGGCHNVHGSDIDNLLAKSYPETFYQGFAMDKYELCFSCHDKELVLQKSAEGLTGFRNGKENLHFLHVNKSDKGRNCRACHSTHASEKPLHVRESVPYGNWLMPINFARTDTGGSCSPGCHKPYEYDRVKPAHYDVPPTTRPSATAETKGKSP